ncbi:UrcA family protein [Erythrobacter rubeus]|uniref:UrcA family protein n=1 Tax=Erythrobacter rubeus TaxID=2760803 RepID=A0ABR8KNR6_9SPHN|nr:UrcA family protein [Erythrobacter rubeus]MBD2841469.1 UrcA family protein [Erythrobacter rubeus]
MNTFIKKAALALSLAAIPAAVFAAPEEHTIAVSYADLNLATDEGTAILDRRIDNAIEKICGGPAPRDVNAGMKVRRCMAKTKLTVSGQRDLAVKTYRTNQLAASDRSIRFAAQ